MYKKPNQVSSVRVGQKVLIHGYKWEVSKNRLNPVNYYSTQKLWDKLGILGKNNKSGYFRTLSGILQTEGARNYDSEYENMRQAKTLVNKLLAMPVSPVEPYFIAGRDLKISHEGLRWGCTVITSTEVEKLHNDLQERINKWAKAKDPEHKANWKPKKDGFIMAGEFPKDDPMYQIAVKEAKEAQKKLIDQKRAKSKNLTVRHYGPTKKAKNKRVKGKVNKKK